MFVIIEFVSFVQGYPMDILNTVLFLNGVATTRRYSNSRLIQDENLIEHTGSVCLFVRILHAHLVSVNPNIKLDLGTLLSRAVLHDIEEVHTGDVPRPTKYYSEEVRQAFETVEEAGVHQILDALGLNVQAKTDLHHCWKNAKSDLEGSLIKLADIAAVVYKMHSEVTLMGNVSMLKTCTSVSEHVEEIRAYLNEVWEFDSTTRSELNNICNQLIDLSNTASAIGARVDKIIHDHSNEGVY